MKFEIYLKNYRVPKLENAQKLCCIKKYINNKINVKIQLIIEKKT